MTLEKVEECRACGELYGEHKPKCLRFGVIQKGGGCPDCEGIGSHEVGCVQWTPPLDTGEEGALRYNEGKPPMSYVTDFPNALWGIAMVMEQGSHKYPRDNWKKGLSVDNYIDSLMRHLLDLKDGLKYDRETHLHQLYHVAVNAMMMAEVHGIKSEPAPTPSGITDGRGEKSEIDPGGMSLGREESPNMTGAVGMPTAEGEAPVQSTHLTIDGISDRQWNWVQEMGWHNKSPLGYLALIASEVGEAVNECRGKTPTPELGSELADIILRTLDFAKEMKIDINLEIFNKMGINDANGNHKEREY